MKNADSKFRDDDAWMCDLITRLGDVAQHSPHAEAILHAQSALITHLSSWRDSAALNYLAAKRPGGWIVRLDGKDWDLKNGRPHKCLERPAFFQVVPSLPWLRRISR